MKPLSCPNEVSVIYSVRTGCWDVSTRAHVAKCAHCREIAQVAGYLANIAGNEPEEHSLPEAEQVWFRGRILAARTAREKSLRPLLAIELVLRAVLTLFLAAGSTWIWFRFQSLAAILGTAHAHLPQPILFSAAALATGAVTLLLIKLFQPVLAEE
jgi:hypothetical protein